MARISCPTGCGSLSFRVARKGVLVQDIEIDEETGDMVIGESIAEAGGFAFVSCECGYHWKSRARALAGVAEFIEGR